MFVRSTASMPTRPGAALPGDSGPTTRNPARVFPFQRSLLTFVRGNEHWTRVRARPRLVDLNGGPPAFLHLRGIAARPKPGRGRAGFNPSPSSRYSMADAVPRANSGGDQGPAVAPGVASHVASGTPALAAVPRPAGPCGSAAHLAFSPMPGAPVTSTVSAANRSRPCRRKYLGQGFSRDSATGSEAAPAQGPQQRFSAPVSSNGGPVSCGQVRTARCR